MSSQVYDFDQIEREREREFKNRLDFILNDFRQNNSNQTLVPTGKQISTF